MVAIKTEKISSIGKKLEQPFWLDGIIRENYAELDGNHNYDIAIVGGGFAGLSTAYHLKKAGYEGKICIVDKNRIGDASARSAGLINASSTETDFVDDIKQSGLQKAVQIWKSYEKGHSIIEEIIRDAKLSCSFEKTGGLYLGTAEQKEYVKEEAKARNNAGFAAIYKEHPEINFGNYDACFLEPTAFSINPLAFCVGLSKYLSNEGIKIFENSHVENIEKNGKLNSSQGVISADKIILAGNNIASSFGIKKPQLPIETYCIVTEPLDDEQIKKLGLEKRFMFWNADMPYNYGRLTADNRLLFGGKDLILGLSPIFSKKKIRELEQDFRKEFTQLNDVKIEYRWGGPIYVSTDFLPSAGRHDQDSVYAISGATGIVHSVLCGKVVTDEIMGRDNEFSKIFSYNRKVSLWPSLAGGMMRNAKRTWELLGG